MLTLKYIKTNNKIMVHRLNAMYVKVITLIVAMLVLWLPGQLSAQSISLDNVSPAVDEDITPPDDGKGATENFYTFWFKGQIDQEYTAVFNVSEEPAFSFVSGGDMSLENNVSYDAATNQFSVTYTAKPLQQIDSQSSLTLEDGQTLTIVAVSFPVEEGEDGPTAATTGAWVATAFQEWTLIMPSADNNVLGATVQGDAADTGRFKMFIPTTTMDVMAEYDGAEADEYAAEDFAIYEDDQQVSGNVQAVTGGSLVDFVTTLPEESSEADESSDDDSTQSLTSGPGVSQDLAVGPKQPVALSANKTIVKAGTVIKLTGWIKSGERNKKVTIEKTTDDKTYSKIKTVRTKKNGKFVLRFKVKTNIGFRALFGENTSDSVYVQVK